ncbi:MAG: Mth938-like domain-containing protein [Gammaproteobacteria bacterium]
MKFNLENSDRYTVISYQPGEITVLLGMTPATEDERAKPQKQTLTSSFILAPDHLQDWPLQAIESLDSSHLEAILALDPELVLLGSGATHRFPDVNLLTALLRAQIGYEVMTSQAACRTYNLLRGEGRRVVAGIIL